MTVHYLADLPHTPTLRELLELLRNAEASLPPGDPERNAAWENAMPQQRPCPDCGFSAGHDVECLSRG